MVLKKFLSFIVFVFISGCASIQPVEYAGFSGSININVSKDIVSTWTETPAGDSHIPDSQVFVAKQGGGASAFGGLLGVAVARSGAKSRASEAKNQLAQYFDDDVKSLVSAGSSKRNLEVSFTDDEENYRFKLLPSAKFSLDKKKNSLLEFRLTTRYNNGSGKPQTKDYYYVTNPTYPMEGENGWFGEEGHFEKNKKESLKLLVNAFLDDISGNVKSVNSTDVKEVQWQPKLAKKPNNALLLKEYDQHVVIVPKFHGNVFVNSLIIVRKSELK